MQRICFTFILKKILPDTNKSVRQFCCLKSMLLFSLNFGFFLFSVILIIAGLDVAVVKLAAAVCRAAELLFKSGVGGDEEERPGGMKSAESG